VTPLVIRQIFLFSREVNTPADNAYGFVSPEPTLTYDDDFVDNVRNKMVAAFDMVHDNLSLCSA